MSRNEVDGASLGDGHAVPESIVVLDTITSIAPEHAGKVVVAASHGGVYPGYCAAKGHARGVILNDAGIGLDDAGIGSLAYLQRLGLPAATVSHRSSRIGDGMDTYRSGIVSHVNRCAAALGCAPGQSAIACSAIMARGPWVQAPVEEMPEARFTVDDGEPCVVALDSISLLRPEDARRVIVSASHGALLGGDPAYAIPLPVYAATFCDAGLGKDDAGASRLPVLSERGIAAVTVSSQSARIGDARSVLQRGIVSRVNERAADLGVAVGASTRDFIRLVAAGWKQIPAPAATRREESSP